MARVQEQEDLDCDRFFSKDVICYQEQVEGILAWLLRKEELLQSGPQESELESASYDQLIDEYGRHEKFLTEFCEFCHAIMKCKEDGQAMRDNHEGLTNEDRDEIDIQIDTMVVCYEKLKILTTDRLHNLKRIIESRQQDKMERLEEWFSAIEKKIASSNNIGPDHQAIQRQIKDLDELKVELERKQEFLNFLSQVVIFDDIDLESLQIRSKSSENVEKRLESLNHRWTHICQFVEERDRKLKSANSIWELLNSEGPQLAAWLTKVEKNLNELSEAVSNVTDIQAERSFISKLLARSDKIDLEIKSKQSFYTRLEIDVRLEIGRLEIDDSCSMLAIELEKKLEEMQDNWNTIMNLKRSLDYTLQQALTSSRPIGVETASNMIPIPDPITPNSRNDLRFIGGSEGHELSGSPIEPLFTQSSFRNNNEPPVNGRSDPRAFDNSLSSDSKSLLYDNNQDLNSFNMDLDSRDEISSPSMTASYPTNVLSNDDSTYSALGTSMLNNQSEEPPYTMSHISDSGHHHESGTSSCRVEEWKHSLESFSNWLKKVEISLAIEEHPYPQSTVDLTWHRLDLSGQLSMLIDIEKQINTTCQDEFNCLLLQCQQIIEDLIPEIGENEYEVNLKEILVDIQMRYSAVKRCFDARKHELANEDRWKDLLKRLRSSCEHLINEMGQIIPESNIGVDLITLAQQQDQLMHAKSNLEGDVAIHANIKEAKLFLRFYDNLQQQYNQSQIIDPTSMSSQNGDHFRDMDGSPKKNHTSCIVDIWMSLVDLREDVESRLDRLTLHYSELSQLIEDRLSRLDNVHKEMHAIQQKMQELATHLQVAEILKSNWISLEGLDEEKLSEQLEELKLYRERLGEVEAAHKSMNSIFDWMTGSNVPLSQSNLKRLDELNTIWTSILDSVEERQRIIEQAFDILGSSGQKFLMGTVADLPQWERRVAPTKIPYFVEHQTKKTIWDHPKFTILLEELSSVKHYVFSAYRTALKLRMLQRRLGINLLMLEQLKEIFDATDIALKQQEALTGNGIVPVHKGVTSNEPLIGVEHIIYHLKVIYEQIQMNENQELDVPLSIDLTLNWLLNLYDSTRTGYISRLAFRVSLALLCCATREEKYHYMFELIANPSTNTADARKLGTLAEACLRIPTYLGEGESFGGPETIEPSIKDCFAMSKFNPDLPNSIDSTDFINWLKTEPQFIVWLPVLHRLLISERTKHPVKCKLCLTKPIVGLRYRCLKCLNFNVCQECFFTGRHYFEHHDPAEHPMQEYCSKTSSGENVRDLTRILRNKIVPKSSSLVGK